MNLVLPALLSLLGAWVGASIALGRFKRERAFDRRAEWYERSVRLVNEISLELGSALHEDARGLLDRVQDHLAKAHALMPRFSAVAAESALYATQDTYLALGTLVEEFNDLGPKLAAAEPDPRVGAMKKAQAAIELFARAADALASDFRNEMGWPQLRGRPMTSVAQRAAQTRAAAG